MMGIYGMIAQPLKELLHTMKEIKDALPKLTLAASKENLAALDIFDLHSLKPYMTM